MKRFPSLQADIAAAGNESLERFREDSRKTVLRLVDMESSYLTVDFFRKLQKEPEKGVPNTAPKSDRYSEGHFRKIGKLLGGHHFFSCKSLELHASSVKQSIKLND